ncbi:hypothetical protein BT69DRAFT_1286610, partial [Atractiella rhizophila]
MRYGSVWAGSRFATPTTAARSLYSFRTSQECDSGRPIHSWAASEELEPGCLACTKRTPAAGPANPATLTQEAQRHSSPHADLAADDTAVFPGPLSPRLQPSTRNRYLRGRMENVGPGIGVTGRQQTTIPQQLFANAQLQFLLVVCSWRGTL